jgi:uncharacterized OsmC-like protein
MNGAFEVRVGSGSLSSAEEHCVRFSHRWTATGVSVESDFTGAHLLHLATAGCVLNDVHREAEAMGIPLRGVRVVAFGSFDTVSWHSLGIEYFVRVDTDAPETDVEHLLQHVDEVAEIPKALRHGATVKRVPAQRHS